MHQLVEMVLRLAGTARVSDQGLGKLRILDAVVLLAGLAAALLVALQASTQTFAWLYRYHVTLGPALRLDEAGRVYLQTDLGMGLVHSQDVVLVAAAVEQGRWSPQSIRAADVPARFGFVQSPEPPRKLA